MSHVAPLAITRSFRRRQRAADNAIGWAFAGPSILLILGLSFIPMVWAFFLSLTNNDLVSGGKFIGLDNYKALLKDPLMATAFKNTLFFTLLYLPVALAAGLGVALLLNRKIALIGFYRTCFLVPFIAAAAAEGLLMGFIFDKDFGLVNSILTRLGLPAQGWLEDPNQALLTLAIVFFWTQFGFNVVIYMAALQDVSTEVLEAADIDGASPWRRFWHIVVPTVRPVTYFLLVWGAIETFQIFDIIFTTTKGGPLHATTTVVLYIWMLAFNFFKAGYGAAVAYVLFFSSLFVIIAALLFARRRGLTM